MSERLVRQVTALSIGVLVAALGLTGAATATLLHLGAVAAHDEALLAAAHAWRVGLGEEGAAPWEADPAQPPVALSLLSRAEAGLPPPRFEGDAESPSFRTIDGVRELRLPVEIERGPEERDVHAVILATSPALSPRVTVGPFALAYGVVAAGTALAGAWLLVARLERAVAPLAQAGADVRRVARGPHGQRVALHGPAEVQALLAEVNGLLDRLDAAWTAQARFTAEAAHELRTPVTVLRGELDLALRRARSPEELAATLAALSPQVDRLARLVDGLMALARIDAGQVEAGLAGVPVAGLVTAAVHQEASVLAAAGCALTVDLADAGALSVRVHEALAVAALANLLRNAAMHAPGCAVALTAQVESELVALHVDDAGPGIAPQDRVAVFDRLQRGPGARASGDGLGLGLALAREVARRLGGDCTVEDSPLGGVRATLRLPREAHIGIS